MTDDELTKAHDLGHTDVLLTHDCPTYAPFKGRLKNDPDSHIHRQKIDRVVESTKAKVHFHGHMHDWYDYENPWGGKIYGLECNDDAMWNVHARFPEGSGGPRNHLILDTDRTTKALFPGNPALCN